MIDRAPQPDSRRDGEMFVAEEPEDDEDQ
jgi:hypothetical protein